MTTAEVELKPDTDASIGFLKVFAPEGPWVLMAIPQLKVEGQDTTTETFYPGDEDRCRDWITLFQGEGKGKQNVYFMANKPIGRLNKKAKKTDVKEMGWLHVDLDPLPHENLKAAHQRICKVFQSFKRKPTYVIFSGGGYQGLWRLNAAEPVGGNLERCEELESYNLQLELVLGGDHCHNLDRVLRLPGTINFPNEKKRKRGQEACLAYVYSHNPEKVYPLTDFETAPSVQGGDNSTNAALEGGAGKKVILSSKLPEIDDISVLPVSDKTKMLIVKGGDPDDPAKWSDRSKLVWHVTCEMFRADIDDDTMAAVLTNKHFGVSAHVLEQKTETRRYVSRQIERVRERVEAERLEFARNKNLAVLRDYLPNTTIGLHKLDYRFSYDEFARREMVQVGDEEARPMTDNDLNTILYAFSERFGEKERFSPPRSTVEIVIRAISLMNKFHPVKDCLEELVWDRQPRIGTWLRDYAGAKDTPLVRAFSRLWFIAAVRRIYEPGCKFDQILMLESPEGKGKSSAFEVLAVDWFCEDADFNLKSKEFREQVSGKWIVEFQEMVGLNGRNNPQVKKLLSTKVDRARMAYDRYDSEKERSSILVGTTNKARLYDPTGNRRFWPVKIECFDIDKLKRDRDQLWAEAMEAHRNGESIVLDEGLRAAAREEQEACRVVDPWVDKLSDSFGGFHGKVKAADVYILLDLMTDRLDQKTAERVTDCMAEIGFEKQKQRMKRGAGPVTVFVRGVGDERRKVLGLEIDEISKETIVYHDPSSMPEEDKTLL